jgi:hypothetical protein
LRCYAIFHTDRQNNSSRCLLRHLPIPQHACTPFKSIRHTCHLGGHPSKYLPSPTLLDFGDQMGTSMSNEARRRSPIFSQSYCVNQPTLLQSGSPCSSKSSSYTFSHPSLQLSSLLIRPAVRPRHPPRYVKQVVVYGSLTVPAGPKVGHGLGETAAVLLVQELGVCGSKARKK